VSPNPEATEMLFDGLRRQVDASVAPGATIQWEFTDAPPWHLQIDSGSASVAPGKADHADLTFRCRFEDWIDLAAGRTEPWRALVTRRLRPSGSLRLLARAPKLFAG
jgi:putative sterol carrier protein